MSQAPAMPLFCDAYLADTMHLSNEESGCYMKLLMVTWRNNGQPLPDDDRRLARILSVSVSKWTDRIRPQLVAFFDLSDGTWRPISSHFEQLDGKRLPWARWVVVRAGVFSRDNHTCTYCGATEDLECDHVIPISRGGTNDPSNLTTACRDCNRAKSDRLPSEMKAIA